MSEPSRPNDPPFGTFRYRPGPTTEPTRGANSAQLTWSDQLFGIYGFEVGQIVPTLAVMASHQHPDDRAAWSQALERILALGLPLSLWHRIIDAGGRAHTLQTSVEADRDGDRVIELRGLTTDLTERLRQDNATQVQQAVARSAETRAVIEQAKGMLMAVMDLDQDQAFDLLRWHSSYTNTKLRDIADTLLRRMAAPELAGTLPRQRLGAILAGLTGPRKPVLPTQPPSDWMTQPPPPVDQIGVIASRIPVALLPRTLVRAVAAAAISITIADCVAEDWPLVYVNAAFEKLTGYPAAEILGRNCRFLQGSATDPAQTAAIRAALVSGSEIRTVLLNHRKDGSAFWNEMHLSAVRDDADRIIHYIGYQSDVSERVERQQQLEHLARHDAATSLPNHTAAVEHLDAAIGAASDDASFSVLHIRLSGFRPTDDSDATEVVRTVLTTAAERLSAALAAPTFLAKLDNDDFLAVIQDQPPDLRDAAEAVFADPIPPGEGGMLITVSIGQARYPRDADTSYQLLDAARADAASKSRAGHDEPLPPC